MRKKVLICIIICVFLMGCEASNFSVGNNETNTDQVEKKQMHYLSDLTDDNIGDYIDFGESLNGKKYKWRVFLNKYKKNKIYVIMADYLPIEDIKNLKKMKMKINYIYRSIGWDGRRPYGAKRPIVINTEAVRTLRNEKNWSYLVPKKIKNNAIAKGAPTKKEFMNSSADKGVDDLYNLDYDENSPDGYWLATIVEGTESDVWSWYCLNKDYSHDNLSWSNGLRPILIIDSSLPIRKEKNSWYIR